MIDREGSLSKFRSSLIGGVHIGARAVLDINLIWLDSIARLSQWGGGGALLVQMTSTCLRCA
jgi:hypothetical protein